MSHRTTDQPSLEGRSLITALLLGLGIVLGTCGFLLADDASAAAQLSADSATSGTPEVRNLVARARTLQRLGIIEFGNVAAFDEALAALDRALGLTGSSANGQNESADLTTVRTEAQNLRNEIESARRAAASTFFGRFPLVRGLPLSKTSDGQERSLGVSLGGSARRETLRTALRQALGVTPADVALAIVLVDPGDLNSKQLAELEELVEHELPGALAGAPNLKLLPADIRAKLPVVPPPVAPDTAYLPHARSLLELLPAGSLPINLLFVRVEEMNPESSDAHWFHVERRVLPADVIAPLMGLTKSEPFESVQWRAFDGFRRERGGVAPLMYWSMVGLGLLAFVCFGITLALGQRVVPSWQIWVVPPAFGFLMGLILPSVVVTGLQGVLPSPTASAVSAAWWPCVVGILMLLVPAVVFRLTTRGVSAAIGGLQIEGHWGMGLVPVALGVSCYWCRPAFMCLAGEAPWLLVPLTIASAALLYVFGRAIDSNDALTPIHAVVAVLLLVPLALATFAAADSIVWLLATVALAWPWGLLWIEKHQTKAEARLRRALAAAEAPEHALQPVQLKSLTELREHAEAPPYHPQKAFAQAYGQLCKCGPQHTTILALCGLSGSGKSATARQLVAQIGVDCPDAEILTASCREQGAPYQPFRDLLSGLWGSLVPAGTEAHGAKLDSVLQEVVGMFVPFWGMLSRIGRAGEANASPSDLFAAVSGTLRKLARKKRVVLLIDNVQWLDEGSAALLRHLIERFPPGGDLPLVILLAGRDESQVRELGITDCILHVPVPSPEDQADILTGSLGIEPASARQIVASLGSVASEPGGLFWLGRAVVELVDAGGLAPEAQGFVLRPEFQAAGKLPVPGDLRRELAQRLRKSADHQLILQCAALIGQVFRVDDLAGALSLDRLQLLQIIGQLERDRHTLVDLPEQGEQCAFSSAFMLEVVREEFGFDPPESTRRHPAKLVQELHGRIAAAVAQRDRDSVEALCALAHHYGLAGDRFAREAVRYGLLAARAARAESAFDDAEHYLLRVRENANADELPPIEREALLIECEKAHVTGRKREAVARRVTGHVDQTNTADHELLVAAARSCHDAGRDTGDPAWFNRAAELAQRMIDQGRTSSEKADGYHLLGISLPLDPRAPRLVALERALELADAPTTRQPATLLQTARILGSLAEQLSYGIPTDRQRAKTLFERGLALRQTEGLGDLPGQARAHGGLGRLAYFTDPPDYDLARYHFLEDLHLAEELGDRAGQSLCHSFLAGCDRAASDLLGAQEHYHQAWQAAESLKDRYFALTGLLETALALEQSDHANQVGRELAKLAAGGAVPRDCAEALSKVLANHGERLPYHWYAALVERVGAHAVAQDLTSGRGAG